MDVRTVCTTATDALEENVCSLLYVQEVVTHIVTYYIYKMVTTSWTYSMHEMKEAKALSTIFILYT